MNIFQVLRLYQDFLSNGANMSDRGRIFLSFDGEKIEFPVVPAELPSVKQVQNNGVFNSVIGDMNTIGLMGLREVTLELFCPSDVDKYNFARGDEANDIINFINKNRPLQKPFNICITKGHVTYLNMDCLINSFEYRMTNTADYYLTIDCVEYIKRESMPNVTSPSNSE